MAPSEIAKVIQAMTAMSIGVHAMCMVSVPAASTSNTAAEATYCTAVPVRRSMPPPKRFW